MSFFRKAQKALEKEKALEKDKEKALEKEKEKQSSASQNGEGQSTTSNNIENERSGKLYCPLKVFINRYNFNFILSFLLLLKNSLNTEHPYALNFHQRFSLIFLPCISELVEPETNPTSDIGKVDTQVINEYVSSTKEASSRSTKYRKWTDKDRYDIGKYAAENGNINAVRKFQTDFPNLKGSTVRTFKMRYYEELRKGKEIIEQSQKIQKFRR